METKGDADFFIFIELDLRSMAPTFYVPSASSAWLRSEAIALSSTFWILAARRKDGSWVLPARTAWTKRW